MRLLAFVCLSVCLSVCQQDYSKTRAWIWMKFCVSTDVRTLTNWLTVEPDPNHSPDARTGLLSLISCALQRGILLRRENPTYRYWAPVAAATRGFIHREPSEQLCRRYMRFAECPFSCQFGRLSRRVSTDSECNVQQLVSPEKHRACAVLLSSVSRNSVVTVCLLRRVARSSSDVTVYRLLSSRFCWCHFTRLRLPASTSACANRCSLHAPSTNLSAFGTLKRGRLILLHATYLY